MQQAELPGNIFVTEVGGSVKVTSELKDNCPYCADSECNFSCDQSQYAMGTDEELESEQEHLDRIQWNAAIDGLESLIMGYAGQGMDINDPKFHKAVQSALDAISNQFGH